MDDFRRLGISKMKKKTLLSWSTGKDSAWTLYKLREDPEIELVGLFTTINEKYNRVNMHGTPVELLRKQAGSADLQLHEISLPDPCTNEIYNATMQSFIDKCKRDNIEYMAFGDIFLPDVREYREKQLKGTGIKPIFPLWGTPTCTLTEEMLSAGLLAYISCIDMAKIPISFVGKQWTYDLLAEYPDDCDPCGENGEIHTVAVDGPMFYYPIPVRVGEIVKRDGFAYADIVSI